MSVLKCMSLPTFALGIAGVCWAVFLSFSHFPFDSFYAQLDSILDYPVIVFMYIVNNSPSKSRRLMAFDHTGVRVTSTPHCGFDPCCMKTVTVGFCFIFLRPSSYRQIQLLDHNCFDLCFSDVV